MVAPMWPTADTEAKPGPGTYEVAHLADYHPTCWGENYWAFNISTRARPDLPSDYDNAPTRYRPELAFSKFNPIGAGYRSVFRSKAQRLDPVKAAVLSERLRPKDIPPHEKHRKDEDDCKLQ